MTRSALLDAPMNRVIGKVIREVREDAGLSREDVQRRTANRIKVTTLASWELGARTVQVERLLDLARVYQVPPDVLMSVIEKRCQG